MKYEVRHVSTYAYERSVDASYHMLRLTPRALPHQRVLRSEIVAAPAPDSVSERTDYFGNAVRFLTMAEPHERLSIEMTATVEVAFPTPPDPDASPAWERAREALPPDAVEFAQDSPFVPADGVADYAAASFPPGRPILAGARDLTRRIHRDFAYDTEATDLATPVAEVVRLRRGVCQDFAHVELAALRSLGLAARYVSGYIRTGHGTPLAGRQPGSALTGADASHAWVSVFCPGSGWVDLDPTNDLVVGEDHIVLAWGRDYGDVSPVRGVILGGGEHKLEVAVEVRPLP
jgi:transglutaminase-like putative cysteine protease